MRYNHLDMLPELAFKPIGKRMTLEGGKAKAPAAPDYTGAATATAAGNLEAARATAAANRTNQVTPYGNLTYTANPGTDPYGNTLYTATQTLSPEQQAIYQQESKLNQGLMSTANTGLQYANQVLSKPGVDLSKLPGLTSNVPGGQYATSYDVQNASGNLDLSGMPALKSSIDTQGLPSYGINPGETYSDAIMRRLQPDLERQRSSEESRLANQGIGLGSNAYSTAKDILGRQQNDALTSAIVQGMGVGLQANQQQFGQNAAQTQAQNAANAQAYQQALASGQFGNQAAAQNTGNAANLAAFGNQGIGQQFQQGLANAQLGNQAQQQGFQQEAYNQMQPINVINALRSGSQVQSPSYASTPQQAQTAGADILGATQQGYNAQLANVNAQNAASGGFMGGLMNLGGTLGGAYLMSDENLKTDIKRIGTHDLGMGIYSYSYKDGYNLPTGIQVGVMAQEVEKVIPEAVIVTDSGFKAVNYAML